MLDYLSKQSHNDELKYPEDPHPKDERSYKFKFQHVDSLYNEPIKKPHEYIYTPNDSLYQRVVQKIQTDEQDKTKSPFHP